MSAAAEHVQPHVPAQPRRVAVRPLAIPNEHGAWSFLLEPLVLGLAVAPSMAGLCFAVAIVAAFFLRHPLRLAARDWTLGKRYPRTRVCVWLSLAYGCVALAAIVTGIALSSMTAAIPFAIVLPVAALQFSCDIRNRGRELTAELCGALTAAAGGAACVLAGNGGGALAGVVALLAISRSVPTILYVRAGLGRAESATALLAHGAAVAAALLAPVPRLAVAALVVLLVRCAVAPVRSRMSARRVGIEEVVWGVLATVCFAVSL